MKLRVSHLIRYEYGQEVYFSPHALYLRPRESISQRLSPFLLNVSPNAKLLHTRDAYENSVTWIHFWDRASALNIRTEFEVETLNADPFDFVLKSQAVNFPFQYDQAERFALGPYLVPPFADTQNRLTNWLDEHLVDRPDETVAFVSALNNAVFNNLVYVRRTEPGIQASLTTLDFGGGNSRDLAVLFTELCRSLGLAARYISGYLYSSPDDSHRTGGDMHAWAEVFLPGAGWRGVDPSHGLFCTDAFVPVAQSALADTVAPLQGSYYSANLVPAEFTGHVLVEKILD